MGEGFIGGAGAVKLPRRDEDKKEGTKGWGQKLSKAAQVRSALRRWPESRTEDASPANIPFSESQVFRCPQSRRIGAQRDLLLKSEVEDDE